MRVRGVGVAQEVSNLFARVQIPASAPSNLNTTMQTVGLHDSEGLIGHSMGAANNDTGHGRWDRQRLV